MDGPHALEALLKIAIAFFMALPIAIERQKSTSLMGLRTFPIVCIASCGYVLMAAGVVGSSPEAQARIIEGLMTGIGFIGAGAVIKDGSTVHGTSTAASVWSVGAAGAAIGYGRYDIAGIIVLGNFLTLFFLTPFSKAEDRK